METVQFATEPLRIQYMPLPDGSADVWLRRNVRQMDTDDGMIWTADEIYVHTNKSRDDIARDFDNYFAITPTAADRLDALEAAITELAEVMADG